MILFSSFLNPLSLCRLEFLVHVVQLLDEIGKKGWLEAASGLDQENFFQLLIGFDKPRVQGVKSNAGDPFKPRLYGGQLLSDDLEALAFPCQREILFVLVAVRHLLDSCDKILCCEKDVALVIAIYLLLKSSKLLIIRGILYFIFDSNSGRF